MQNIYLRVCAIVIIYVIRIVVIELFSVPCDEANRQYYTSSLPTHVRIQRRDRVSGPPLKNHKTIEFSSNTGPDTLKIPATKPAFNVGPSSARQRNAI